MTGARTSDSLPPDPALVAAANRAGLAYAAAFILLSLASGPPDGIEALIGLPFVYLWCLGPAIVAAVMVRAARTRGGQWTFLVAEGAVFASMSAAIVNSVFIEQDPKAGLFILTFAFLQYCGLFHFAVVASLCGWRARDEWR